MAWLWPVRSRRSMKMTAPWSRRRWHQPIRTTVLPVSEARSSPHIWVRRRSPRKSSTTEVSISINLSSSQAWLRFRRAWMRFHRGSGFLLARGHVFERVAAGGHFVVADNQRKTRSEFIGQFHGALQLALHQFYGMAAQPQIARHHGGVPEGRFAQRRDENIERGPRRFALHDRNQTVFADGETDARRMHLGAQRFGEAIVPAAAQYRVLRAERAVDHFERGAHVVIETPHHARRHFVVDTAVAQVRLHGFEMRAAGIAE